ncbi:hypothetical protein LWH94_07740 [Marinobacter sp. G11]|jgi:hypothetical protein|uniref:hypothetical protein n=1 Tax=Marinobacter sp. G11 TaxID=2903522 RepID=UPI001E355D67|nr:hypothetical protein [Marinobacter sp. G11]MCE0759094.1 hypothetical protein [Marinobacter sp. G11]|tara:strand:+ start:2583 stop:2753 length:171 start_codon:yes stop_codon:yes gene_type:complete
MQLKEAKNLNEKNQEPDCQHTNLSKEYYLGSATGDYVCTNCGKSGHGREWVDNKKS